MIKNLPVVISASRMTDMPAFYPQHIISEIETRKEKGLKIHTIVLWTKHISAIFKDPLHTFLEKEKKLGTQIYVQLTLTGIGENTFVAGKNNKKVFLEPCVPNLSESVKLIDQLIDLTENPDRIRLRIDPLIRIKDAEEKVYSNFEKLFEIIELLWLKEIRNYSFSFLENDIYKKVDKRFITQGLEILAPDTLEREDFAKQVKIFSLTNSVSVSACSVPGLSTSACIDGNLLQQLHDQHWPLDLTQPHSRDLCGCTKSIDIGGWPPKICNSGCLYCYSQPKINPTKF